MVIGFTFTAMTYPMTYHMTGHDDISHDIYRLKGVQILVCVQKPPPALGTNSCVCAETASGALYDWMCHAICHAAITYVVANCHVICHLICHLTRHSNLICHVICHSDRHLDSSCDMSSRVSCRYVSYGCVWTCLCSNEKHG